MIDDKPHEAVDAGEQNDDDAVHALAWGVETSVRYHERRQAYYEGADAFVNAVNLIAGSGAVLAIAKSAPAQVIVWLTAAVAILSFINLTMRSSHMAAVHSQMKQRFVELLKRIRRLDPEAKTFSKKLGLLEQRRLSIEMEEPTIYRVVSVLAHNELAFANGYGDEVLWHVPWYKHLTAHFIRWEPTGLVTRAAKKASK